MQKQHLPQPPLESRHARMHRELTGRAIRLCQESQRTDALASFE
jgi:hypothetical protein